MDGYTHIHPFIHSCVCERDESTWKPLGNFPVHKSRRFFFFFFFAVAVRNMGVLVLWPGIRPVPPAVEVQNLNPWTARGIPSRWYFEQLSKKGRGSDSGTAVQVVALTRSEIQLLLYLEGYMLSRFSHVWLFVTPWTVAHQAPLSMRFSRQEYWRGLPCPPGDLPNAGIKPVPLMFPALAGRFFTSSATIWKGGGSK